MVHLFRVWLHGLGLDVLPELRPLPELRVHLQRVNLLCRLLNEAGDTNRAKEQK